MARKAGCTSVNAEGKWFQPRTYRRASPLTRMLGWRGSAIIAVHGGAGAHLQLFCLRTAALLFARTRAMQWLVWLLGRFFDEKNGVTVQVPYGGKLRIFLNDGYWISLISSRHEYEPEVGFLLRHFLRGEDAVFLDCGANIGYWSVVASGLTGPGRVIAVEAASPIFDLLVRNAALNSNRFDCVLAAVWHRDGDSLSLVRHERRHARSSVVDLRDRIGEAEYSQERISSITLDTLCERQRVTSPCLVIKLDVEGAELPALAGARLLTESRQVVVIYEDHGSDEQSRVSRHILTALRFNVYYCGPDFRVQRVETPEALERIKRERRVGYNLAACPPDSAFTRVLDELVGSSATGAAP
jgi:FkbM family methyltransferase